MASHPPHASGENRSSVNGQATELVCFRLDEENALQEVKRLGANPDEVQNLPVGSVVSLNRVTRARLAGKVF